ncbi:MAG: PAAR domain-containing protein [Acidobacteria bacterium]|nr:PAAR domain-containing protein [Acidobacteriota bacterium]
MASQPIAKEGDTVTGTDIHIVMVPSPGGPVPTPMPGPFAGRFKSGLSTTTFVDGKTVALEGDSVAKNEVEHVAPVGTFQSPPKNEARVRQGGACVFVDGKPVVRSGDTAFTCADPEDAPTGTVVAEGTVFAGE